jgi:hypothetical protein
MLKYGYYWILDFYRAGFESVSSYRPYAHVHTLLTYY